MAYNDKIVIEQGTETRSSNGAVDVTWATYKTVWAEIESSGGTISYETEMPVYSDNMAFRIHKHDAPGVTTKMRIKDSDSNYYWIRSIQKDGRLWLTLTGEAFDDE